MAITTQRWHDAFTELLRVIEEAVDSDRIADAMVLAYIASALGANRMTGYYSAPGVERPFLIQANRIPFRPTVTEGKGSLYIFTQAYRTGGHTALVIQNILEGPDREPATVLLTGQRLEDAPSRLHAAVESSGGTLCSLIDTEGTAEKLVQWWRKKVSRNRRARRRLNWSEVGLRKKVEYIRSLAQNHRRVILSLHMDDPWPTLAFGHAAFPRPVYAMNVADHMFWLGRSVVDAVLDFREFGQIISSKRRGSPASMMLPFLFTPGSAATAEEKRNLRNRLGLPAEATIVVSVGSPYKFAPIDGVDFQAFLAESLARSPSVVHLVIGPPPDDAAWSTLRREYGGRLVMPGGISHENLEEWLRASDVYLSSFPLGGGMAVMDAVRVALPVVMLETAGCYFGTYKQEQWISPDVDSLQERLSELVSSSEQAALLGKQQFDHCLKTQGLETWRASMEKILSLPAHHAVQRDWDLESGIGEYEDYFNRGLANTGFSDAKLRNTLLARCCDIKSHRLKAAAKKCLS